MSENDLLHVSLDRANKRINTLAEQVQRLEQITRARETEVSNLQAIVTRLKDGNLQLDERVAELIRNNQALRTGEIQKERQIGSLVRSSNRMQNNLFWSVCHFVAGSDEFEAYANNVGYDLTRLFCMLLAAEIREDGDLSPEIKTHAATVADIFDPFFYLTEYQDVALDGVNPLLHYVLYGYKENRNPTQLFDCTYYAEQARLRGKDPLLHYILKGVDAGLKPHPLFDSRFYWDRNPDVAVREINPLFHYQTWGGRERRDPSPLFDTEYFLESRNLPTMVENPLREYLIGVAQTTADPHPLFLSAYFREQARLGETDEVPLIVYEKRPDLNQHIQPHPLFDLAYMRERQGVVFDEDMSPIESFCKQSRERDIDPSILFDSKLYRYQVEVEQGRKLTDPPIIDYLKRGYKDKTLLPNLAFDPKAYIDLNKIEVSGPELTDYCLVGDRAGYLTHPLFSTKFYNDQRAKDDKKTTALEHFLTAEPSKVLRSHKNISQPLSHDVIKFAARVLTNDENFDPDFYRELYPDLASLSDADAKSHYDNHGKSEGRFGSARALFKAGGMSIRDLNIGFFFDEYLHLQPDLAAIGTTFLPLFGHYALSGWKEGRTIGRWQYYLDALELNFPTSSAPLSVSPPSARVDVGVLMHIFYPDLWPELAAFARNFNSVSRDVFVNVVDIAWSPSFHIELRKRCPGAFVQLSNDNGRDIGGFIRLLDNVDIKKYDYFAWMHSKKSPHIAVEKGEYWRRSLLRAFAGSEDIVAENIQMLKDDPTIGIIASREWRSTYMGKNSEQYQRMLDMFEIGESHRELEYVSGTMFLMRSDIVQKLYDRLHVLEWEYGGDNELAFHMDGQAAHAVERIIGNLTRQMGYHIAWR